MPEGLLTQHFAALTHHVGKGACSQEMLHITVGGILIDADPRSCDGGRLVERNGFHREGRFTRNGLLDARSDFCHTVFVVTISSVFSPVSTAPDSVLTARFLAASARLSGTVAGLVPYLSSSTLS